MYPELEKELQAYERRTPKSRTALEKARSFMPLGVTSNFRSYEPYPLFIRDANGVTIHDLDGNQYTDFNLCFGALMAGHCHPAVVKAVEERLHKGTMFGMPHELERELAEEICARYPVEQVRFGNSGTEATMHAVRVARGYTGRDFLLKMEGGYHGVHDAVMVSVKPKKDTWGSGSSPKQVPASGGIPQATIEKTLVAIFNDLPSAQRQFEEHPKQIAAVIVEPIMMNVGICMPEPGFLEGLRKLCTEHGALLIFDEVKTGAKLARGGACEYFKIKPDVICLAKSIGGGFPLAAFAASKKIMDVIADFKVFHAGTYNTNPVVMAAGLATFRHVLTEANYKEVDRHNKDLVAGYSETIRKNGIHAYAIGAGANGAFMIYGKEIRNYRDWTEVDLELWRHYWFAMVNRGILPQPHWWDEQWTISVAHTDAHIERHIKVFAEVAPALAKAQQERMAVAAR